MLISRWGDLVRRRRLQTVFLLLRARSLVILLDRSSWSPEVGTCKQIIRSVLGTAPCYINALSRDFPGFQLSNTHHEIKRDPMFHFMPDFCNAREVASSDFPFPIPPLSPLPSVAVSLHFYLHSQSLANRSFLASDEFQCIYYWISTFTLRSSKLLSVIYHSILHETLPRAPIQAQTKT
jgi:hypothetical protein